MVTNKARCLVSVYIPGFLEVNVMHSAGGNLHFIHKISFYCEEPGNKVLHAVTFMVSTSIIFQFWQPQHLDAAVRMFGDAACVECHVTHKIGLHLARSRLDIKVPLLKRSALKINKHDRGCSAALFLAQHS